MAPELNAIMNPGCHNSCQLLCAVKSNIWAGSASHTTKRLISVDAFGLNLPVLPQMYPAKIKAKMGIMTLRTCSNENLGNFLEGFAVADSVLDVM